MTAPSSSRARRRGVAVAVTALAAVLTGCVGDRERLVPPRIVLELFDTVVPPGGRVSGRVVGLDDRNGLSSIAARARTGDSAFVQREQLWGLDSAEFIFSLYVPATAAEGTPIEVTASIINEQLLSRDTTAYAVVRVPRTP